MNPIIDPTHPPSGINADANIDAHADTTVRRRNKPPLAIRFQDDPSILEVGVDEAGRGPMFGRVYAGAAILPSSPTAFDHTRMKDSKKFSSKAKLEAAETYIKEHAISWAVAYEDERSIERNNILRATQMAMHTAIHAALRKVPTASTENTLLIIDGNYFTPFIYTASTEAASYTECRLLNSGKPLVNHVMVKGGDNLYTNIAAASILAKTARDRYVHELCEEYPELSRRYGIDKNMGYGTKQHMDGIRKYGITSWHRRTFGACKDY
jgi:ribonuclease HII